MRTPLKLLCILAHPDDESIALGGTLAKYAAEGVETSLVVATRGERGWYDDWSKYPGEYALGKTREQEVREASHVLGITRLEFLDYIDGDLDLANEHEVVAKLVRIIRLIRPDVVLTFGPEGLYGHPDHIAISQFATSAVMCAADQHYPFASSHKTHRVSKLYYRVSTADWFERYTPIFGDLIMNIDGQERCSCPWQKWAITTRLDTQDYWQDVWDAVRCHKTQIANSALQRNIPVQEHKQIWGPQEYYRVFSLVNGGRREEHDLFEGLRSNTAEEAYATIQTTLTITTPSVF